MQTTEMNFLSCFKTSDVYNPDTLAADEEAIRKYYMRNGYADFRIINTEVVYDPAQKGYIVTISLDEGPQYHVSGVQRDFAHLPRVAGDELAALRHPASGRRLQRDRGRQVGRGDDARPGAARLRLLRRAPARRPRQRQPHDRARLHRRRRAQGLRRAHRHRRQHPHPRLRDPPRVRHRRRRPLQPRPDRARRAPPQQPRLLQDGAHLDPARLGARPHHRRPSTSRTSRRVRSACRAAIRRPKACSPKSRSRRPTSSAAASTCGSAPREGQYSNGWGVTFTEPYFLDQRLAGGFDIFHKQQLQNTYALYETNTTGVNLRLGVPVTDEMTFQPNYSLYETQISIPNTSSQPYNDCGNPDVRRRAALVQLHARRHSTAAGRSTASDNCLTNGEASVAIKEAAAQGQIDHLAGRLLADLGLARQPQEPDPGRLRRTSTRTSPASAATRSSSARPSTAATTTRSPTISSASCACRAATSTRSAPARCRSSTTSTSVRRWCAASRRAASARATSPTRTTSQANSLGGTTYFGGTAEVQFPIFGLPREIGLKGALFADAGTLSGFNGRTNFSACSATPTARRAGPTR